jgi:hypothetical protein
MIISAKRIFRPGDCVAVERANNYLNLRGMNRGFCNPDNQATMRRMQPDNVASAQRCKKVREQLPLGNIVDKLALKREEIEMLCDGS